MDNKLKILLCEDEENLGNILVELLQTHDYIVDRCADGLQGWQAFQTGGYDLCLLDVMMPRKDGLSLAKDIRRISNVPIIFLTAMGMRDDVLEGFHAGADDYITKPFSIEELILRIEAVLRRVGKLSGRNDKLQTVYEIGDYTFNTSTQHLTYRGAVQRLTTKESELLSLLCQHMNHTLERAHALNTIWGITEADRGGDSAFSQRSMDVYITKLRRMLAADDKVEIKNVHGRGYKLVIIEP